MMNHYQSIAKNTLKCPLGYIYDVLNREIKYSDGGSISRTHKAKIIYNYCIKYYHTHNTFYDRDFFHNIDNDFWETLEYCLPNSKVDY